MCSGTLDLAESQNEILLKNVLSSGNINITSEHRTTLWMASNLPGAERMLSIAASKNWPIFSKLETCDRRQPRSQAERGGDEGAWPAAGFPPGPPPHSPRARGPPGVSRRRLPGPRRANGGEERVSSNSPQFSNFYSPRSPRGPPFSKTASPIPPILRVTDFHGPGCTAKGKLSERKSISRANTWAEMKPSYTVFARFWGRKSGNWRSRVASVSAIARGPRHRWGTGGRWFRTCAVLPAPGAPRRTLGAFGGKSWAFPGRKWRSGGSRDAWAQQEAALAPTLGRREDYFLNLTQPDHTSYDCPENRVGCLY